MRDGDELMGEDAEDADGEEGEPGRRFARPHPALEGERRDADQRDQARIDLLGRRRSRRLRACG